MRVLLALLATVVALSPLSATASPDTTYFGGTFWNPDSSRWQAIQDSVWTFDTGVGSAIKEPGNTYPHVDPLKSFGMHAIMEGWIGIDFTYVPAESFRRLSQADFPGSEACVGSAAGLGGDYSFWAGVLPSEAEEMCFLGGAGYGNRWWVCIDQTFTYDGSGVVNLSYNFVNDTEPGRDFTRLWVDTDVFAVNSPILLAEYDGQVSGTENLRLKRGRDLPKGPGTIMLSFCVSSDSTGSDEDGGHPTQCGAFALDNVSMTGGIEHFADFETDDDGWTLRPSGGSGGDWSGIWHLNALPPMLASPCNLMDSVLAFAANSFWNHNLLQDNVAASPWIDLGASGLSGATGKLVEFDVYMANPIQSYLFVQVLGQWYPYICPSTGELDASPFVPSGTLYNFGGENPFCTYGDRIRVDLSSAIDPQAERVRIAVGVVVLCRFFEDCFPVWPVAPWFDNIRLGVYEGSPVSVPEEPRRSFQTTLGSIAPNPLIRGAPGRIRFSLSARAYAKVEVFDIAGRSVRTVFEGEGVEGWNEVVWDGRDTAGRPLPDGVYFYSLRAEGQRFARKLVMIR